jgi:hypothetical protein
MLNKRRQAAMKVVQSLYAAEDAIDVALARAADLNSTLVTARAEAEVSALMGHDAFEVAASAFAALARARCDIVEAHKRLSETKIQMGMRAVSFGDSVPKPSPVADLGRASHLQAVA